MVSSDWKNWGDLEQMQEMYITRGIKPPIDLTPDMKDFDENGFGFFKWKNLLKFAKENLDIKNSKTINGR